MAASITWILLKVTLEFHVCNTNIIFRGGSRAAATSKMEWFMTIVNGWKPLTIIAKLSILDVAAALDPPLILRQGIMMIIFHETQIDTGYLWHQGCYMKYFKKQNEILWLWFPKILQVLVLFCEYTRFQKASWHCLQTLSTWQIWIQAFNIYYICANESQKIS